MARPSLPHLARNSVQKLSFEFLDVLQMDIVAGHPKLELSVRDAAQSLNEPKAETPNPKPQITQFCPATNTHKAAPKQKMNTAILASCNGSLSTGIAQRVTIPRMAMRVGGVDVIQMKLNWDYKSLL